MSFQVLSFTKIFVTAPKFKNFVKSFRAKRRDKRKPDLKFLIAFFEFLARMPYFFLPSFSPRNRARKMKSHRNRRSAEQKHFLRGHTKYFFPHRPTARGRYTPHRSDRESKQFCCLFWHERQRSKIMDGKEGLGEYERRLFGIFNALVFLILWYF